WQLLVFEGAQTALQIFLYGIYVHFFISAIHNLHHQKGEILATAGKAILVSATWAMLLFGMTQIALHLILTVLSLRLTRQLVQVDSILTACDQDNIRALVVVYNTLVLASDVIFALNKNDAPQLLYILLPAALIVSTVALAVFKATAINLFYSRLRAVLVMAAVTNLCNAAHVGLPAGLRTRYNTALAIVYVQSTHNRLPLMFI
ncbi:hypothetical protein B0H11DRAFT_2038015, partial [Mycena galericulata]